MKKHLPIDLVSANCLSPEESLKALDYCNKFFSFNRTILFTSEKNISSDYETVSIDKFESIHDYSNFMLKIGNYTSSSHVLVVQDDGHIVNPINWDEKFLEYDYIGAPWPTSSKWRKRWNRNNLSNAGRFVKKNRVGNGGFSLRSRKFLDYSAKFDNCNGIAEDVFLCLENYLTAIDNNIKFAPFDIAFKFSAEVPLKGRRLNKENKNVYFDKSSHFGWHGKRFMNYEELLNLKNQNGDI